MARKRKYGKRQLKNELSHTGSRNLRGYRKSSMAGLSNRGSRKAAVRKSFFPRLI